MRNRDDRAHLFLVGELLAQVLADARRKLSRVGGEAPKVERIARRLRRRRPAATADPPPADGNHNSFANFFAEIFEEVLREEERREFSRRAEVARRMRDATDEKRRG